MSGITIKPLTLKSKLNDGLQIGVCETSEFKENSSEFGDIIIWINHAYGGQRKGVIVNKDEFIKLIGKLKEWTITNGSLSNW